jgi:hypothetical protein
MRVTRSRWYSVVIATMVWPVVWSGEVLAQDNAVPFRPACELVTRDAVSAVLGVDVTPADAMPDAWCSYMHGDQQVAVVGLSPGPPLVLRRIGSSGAVDVTVGGLPALSSPGPTEVPTVPARLIVGLPDGGTLTVEVENETWVADPATAARALAEAILATGPLTAHASTMSTAEPIGFSGSQCELVTLDELRQITGQTFADAGLDVNEVRCRYRTKDRKAMVSVGIGAADLGLLRSTKTRDLTVSDRQAVFVPATKLLAVDLGAGQLLVVRIQATGRGIKAKELPALSKAIAEAAMGRMTAGAITCAVIPTDEVESATGLDLQPIAKDGPDWCWFVTPDERSGLVLSISPQRDLATAWEVMSPSFPDLPTPTDLEVSGHPAFGASAATGTVLAVDLDGSSGQDGKVLVISLLGAHPSVTDLLAMLESVAAQVLVGM